MKLLKFLEDPRYPSLGPHMRFLTLIGLWHPDINSRAARAKLAFYYIIIAFFFSQYLKCIINFKPDSLKLIIQYAPFHMGVVKTLFFQKDYNKWERLIKFISKEELLQISKKDKDTNAILDYYISRIRRVTYFYWMLVFISNITIFTEPYQKNQIGDNGTSVYLYLFDGYTPFEREPPGYYLSMFIQTILGNMMSAYVACWDMLVVSLMIVFAGQLRVIRLNCERVIDGKSIENSRMNIADCHQTHTTLVQYQKEFNFLLSSVMFIYLFNISINLGMCIIQLAEIEDDLPTLVSGCVYILAILIQLLMFYWHANEVTVESLSISYSTFKSSWVNTDRRVQKEIAILALTTTKRLVFKTGPYNEMSLATFVAILRASYSFYTLLKETNN